jgi:(4-(4-[2-(gamma-L-glutamylamino)ethyl]phenoxymethyl)furan-2-yl)methanamine synthase
MIMKIAGFDIGGANTDLAVVDFDKDGEIREIITDFEYLPMWQEKEQLSSTLIRLLGNQENEIQAVGVCMTAELVDAYWTKKEGVLDIAGKVKDSFQLPVGFIGYQGVVDYNRLVEDPVQVAAANWIATSRLAGYISSECIMMDTGSTTTDIIPVKDGNECAKGKSDLQRLGTGELVYSGALRTNLAALVDKVPLDGSWIRVASELFAISADVHLVLGNISTEDYSCSTPDGAGKTVEDCMRRISRVVCGDLDVLTPQDIRKMADYIYQQQVLKISQALQEVSKRNKISKVVTTGLGLDFIDGKASALADIPSVGMDQLLSKDECVVAPAVGTAILMEEFLGR